MPISSIAETQQVIQNLSSLQTQGANLEEQISTGLVSQTYSGIATQAEQLVDLTAQQSQQQAYINTINSVNTRLQTMSLATSTIATEVQQFASELETNAYNTSGTTIQAQAQSLLTEIGGYLNSQDGEGYIFSGSEDSTAPFNAAGLPDPGDLTTAVNGAYPDGYYQGNDAVLSAQVDTSLNVSYGITADNSAFGSIVQVLNFLANSGPLDQDNSTDVANVDQAEQTLSTAVTQVQQLTSQIGENQSELNDVLEQQQQAQTLTETNISNIDSVNSATAITELDSLQTQLEASYQTVNVLQNLTLANYLKD